MADSGFDPYANREVKKPLSNFEAFVSLLKCCIGTGCLAMPMAFHNAGWVNGIISSLFIGGTVIYAIHLLFHSIYKLCQMQGVGNLSYSMAMQGAIEVGPSWLKPLAIVFRVLVEIFLILFHFGVCAVYVVFIAHSLKDIGDNHTVIDSRIYMAVLTLPLILIFSIRNIKSLVPFSITADILLFLGFSMIVFSLIGEMPPLSDRVAFQELEHYPLFFGCVLFSLEAVGVILAIEANMATPQSFLGLFGIFNCALFIVLMLYMLFGFFGYWHYGDEIAGSITLNLPQDELFAQCIKVMFAIAIYFTYTLEGSITIDVLYKAHLVNLVPEDSVNMWEYIVRVLMVLLSVSCAIAFPILDLFISLVGSFCLSTLGLIFPAIIDLCVHYESGYGFLKYILLRDIFIMLFGFAGGAAGTYTSVSDILKAYNKGTIRTL